VKILVTGCAGYIGSTLTGYLLEAGHEVTALDNFSHWQNSLASYCANPQFSIIRADCRDNRVMKPLVAKADVIIPLAAIVGVSACKADETAARSTNYQAVRMICDFASPAQRIVFPNTNSGYGVGDADQECTEDSPLRPLSLYGTTKVEAEASVMQRENSVAFRLATVFGASPRMRVDLLVNDFVYRAVTDRALVLFEAHFRRNFIHVRDTATAFVNAIRRWESFHGKVYNVGDSRANLTKRKLCDRIAQHAPGFTYTEAAVGEDPDKRDYAVSNRRIENTGWMPSHTLDQGIVELVKLYTGLRDRVHGNA
jgi:nucleoside-diphosphate-sugar epimerase